MFEFWRRLRLHYSKKHQLYRSRRGFQPLLPTAMSEYEFADLKVRGKAQLPRFYSQNDGFDSDNCAANSEVSLSFCISYKQITLFKSWVHWSPLFPRTIKPNPNVSRGVWRKWVLCKIKRFWFILSCLFGLLCTLLIPWLIVADCCVRWLRVCSRKEGSSIFNWSPRERLKSKSFVDYQTKVFQTRIVLSSIFLRLNSHSNPRRRHVTTHQMVL